MASRRKGRILAFQALYSWDVRYSQTGDTSIADDLLDFPWVTNNLQLDEEMTSFSRLLIAGTVENIVSVDRLIEKHLENWELKRLNRVDLAVLRMSVYSLMFQTDIHPSIVIDEAIDISKEFGTNDSYRFVNGVLDSIRKTLSSTTVASK
ncbi:MAG: transcription antitermination factor NusB [Treponema sp.]|jgi:N utilization substance protein B|nr:transcription antitermination factor NusB [Treponema sp.]